MALLPGNFTGAPYSEATRDPTTIPFASTSVWNVGIGSGAVWSNNTDSDVKQLHTLHGAINTNFFGQPIYFGTASDPLVTIANTDPLYPVPPQTLHIPLSAIQAAGTDQHMNFYDATQPGKLWSYFGVSFNNGHDVSGGLTAFLGGVWNTTGDGVTNTVSPGSDYDYAVGVITDYDLSIGQIDHAVRMAISIDALKSGGATWTDNIPFPNTHEDWSGPQDYTGLIPAGATFGIPAGVNLGALGLSQGGLVLAQALQRYGAIWRDSGGTNQATFYSTPESANNALIQQMQADMAKIIPQLEIMRNQSATSIMGGGTPIVPPLALVSTTGLPPPPPPPPPTDPVPITVGSGPDSLLFKISEDSYANGDGTSDAKGDATFTVSVDGKQIGGTLTATGSHNLGQEQIVTVNGSFGPGTHAVAVNFLNDAWDGKSGSANDRNLYVDSIIYDGVNTNQSAVIYSPTATFYSPVAKGFTVTGTSTPPPPPPPPPPPTGPVPVTVGAGPDSLVLHVSEDAWANKDGTSDAAGDATFTVMVDGKQVGGTFTATGSHALGQEQAFTVSGYFGIDTHDVAVNFLNDAWGGTVATDRNLYVDDVTYKGVFTGQSATFLGGGAQDFFVNGGTTQPSITIKTSSQPTVTVDGTTVHQETDYGAIVKLTAPGIASITLGATADALRFIGMSQISVVGGVAGSSLTADGGKNTFTPGKGGMTVTGGPDGDSFVYLAGSGNLTVNDFSLAKGDALTIDKSLQTASKQSSDGHGGTLISFGSAAGKIDLLNVASLPSGTLHFQ